MVRLSAAVAIPGLRTRLLSSIYSVSIFVHTSLTATSLFDAAVGLPLFGGAAAVAYYAPLFAGSPQEAKRALMSWEAGDFQPVLGEA